MARRGTVTVGTETEVAGPQNLCTENMFVDISDTFSRQLFLG
jgi:hypothetical protein